MPVVFKSRPRLQLAVIVCGVFLSFDAMAMRCGNYLITEGDTKAKVLKYCGEPVQVSKRLGLRSGVYLNRSADRSPEKELRFSRGHFIPYGQREVLVEDWVFNFGPNKLMRQVTFENGIVDQVRELGYGYRE